MAPGRGRHYLIDRCCPRGQESVSASIRPDRLDRKQLTLARGGGTLLIEIGRVDRESVEAGFLAEHTKSLPVVKGCDEDPNIFLAPS